MVRDCPRCGASNDDALGVMPFGGPDAGELKTDRVKCSDCGLTYPKEA